MAQSWRSGVQALLESLRWRYAWAIANPETTGAIEPTVLSAKRKKYIDGSDKPLYYYDLVDENVDQLLARLKAWSQLQRKANKDKKVALLYYNHSQGKQNIGASYLNVFRSVDAIAQRMKSARLPDFR